MLHMVFQKEVHNFESLYKFIQRTCTVFFECHNVAKYTKFYLR
jgi:hypothetical protein